MAHEAIDPFFLPLWHASALAKGNELDVHIGLCPEMCRLDSERCRKFVHHNGRWFCFSLLILLQRLFGYDPSHFGPQFLQCPPTCQTQLLDPLAQHTLPRFLMVLVDKYTDF